MLFTVNYDGVNHESDEVDEAFIDAYYDKYPLTHHSCDVLESKSDDIYKAYEEVVDMSDHRLSISYVEVYIDKKWRNVHEIIGD